MAKDRIAQFLLRSGAITEEQIQRALLRQRSRGGRIGSHLLYFRFVSEAQLVGALAEQSGWPAVALEDRHIPPDVLTRLPAELAVEHAMLPFQYDVETETLHIAMADPSNGTGLAEAKRRARARELRVYVAVDSILRERIAGSYPQSGRELFLDQSAELPPLAPRPAPATAAPAVTTQTPPAPPPGRRVLLVGGAGNLGDSLRPIFAREGYELEQLTEAAAVARALRENAYEHVLLARDLEERFAAWVRSGEVATPRTEVSVFTSVTEALLDNPAPYKAVAGSLIRALQQLASLRLPPSTWHPPYALICEDLRNLATALGLRRLAVDGLQIAAHLLVPARDVNGDGGRQGAAIADAADPAALHFDDFNHSLEIAQALRFPWDVEGCLLSFSQLCDEASPSAPESVMRGALAAQILALVWYRHAAFRDQQAPVPVVQAVLRRQATRLASPEVVETFLRILAADSLPATAAASLDPVLLVSEPNDVAEQLSVHLKYGGFRVVEVENLPAARQLLQRVRPKAVLVNHQRYREGALELCEWVKRTSGALVYAFSSLDKPSLIMELLDAGFDDVYVPPFNFNVIVTRIGRSLERGPVARPAPSAAGNVPGFRGSLQELHFVDLVQTLGLSQRSVRIDLVATQRERATVYMRAGRIVHAVCGPVTGAEAIYRIIGWRDEGRFATAPVTRFPADNISQSNDILLFEGCRLLDEAPR